MTNSILFSMLSKSVLKKWRSEEEDKPINSTKFENELLERLKTEINENSKDTLTSYSLAVEDRLDYLHYCLSYKILNLGIKIGMELESSFQELEENKYFI